MVRVTLSTQDQCHCNTLESARRGAVVHCMSLSLCTMIAPGILLPGKREKTRCAQPTEPEEAGDISPPNPTLAMAMLSHNVACPCRSYVNACACLLLRQPHKPHATVSQIAR